MIWSALEQSDHILSVGYQPAGETNVSDRLASIDINSIKWKTAKLQVLSLILKEEARTNAKLSIDKLEEWPEFVLPVMDIKVMNLSTVKALRASKLVRYAEPMGYEPRENSGILSVQSSSGCGSNVAEPGLIAGTDYTTITP